jgi:hypothetical protein
MLLKMSPLEGGLQAALGFSQASSSEAKASRGLKPTLLYFSFEAVAA